VGHERYTARHARDIAPIWDKRIRGIAHRWIDDHVKLRPSRKYILHHSQRSYSQIEDFCEYIADFECTIQLKDGLHLFYM